jgi:hypothetical protein
MTARKHVACPHYGSRSTGGALGEATELLCSGQCVHITRHTFSFGRLGPRHNTPTGKLGQLLIHCFCFASTGLSYVGQLLVKMENENANTAAAGAPRWQTGKNESWRSWRAATAAHSLALVGFGRAQSGGDGQRRLRYAAQVPVPRACQLCADWAAGHGSSGGEPGVGHGSAPAARARRIGDSTKKSCPRVGHRTPGPC